MADELEGQGEHQPLSLRDALMSAVEEHREPAENQTILEGVAPAIPKGRDEAGKFAKTAEQTPNASAEATPILTRPPMPSSWKKEFAQDWEKVDPKVAEYLAQREREYATGVSTYKTEAERSRNLQQAMEPFMPDLQKYNIRPDEWITNLGRAHQTLALGTPQQKMQMFGQLAKEYGIDLGAMVGQPGAQPQFDPMHLIQQQMNPIRGEVAQIKQFFEQQQQAQIDKTIRDFAADTTNHPHFADERVKAKMSELLQTGLAPDLESAYELTTRLLDDIWEASQVTQKAQGEVERKTQQAAAAKSARAKVVSVKSATPSGGDSANGAKGRREVLAEAFASHGSARV